MQVRFSEKEVAILKKASLQWGSSYSEIARRAWRKVKRLNVDVDTIELPTTYGGEALRLTGITADAKSIRRAIIWVTQQYDLNKKNPPIAQKAIEGVDYIVEEW